MAQTTLINDIYGVVGSQGEIADQRNKMIETVTLKPSDKQEEFFLFNGRSPIVDNDGQPVRVRVR